MSTAVASPAPAPVSVPVPASAPSPVAAPEASPAAPVDSSLNVLPDDLKVGDAVEARYMSGLEWFGAKVVSVGKTENDGVLGADPVYSLRYDDGDEEAGASRRKLRLPGQRQKYESGAVLPAGLRVDAACALVVKAKLLPGHANCLPGVVVSGPSKPAGAKGKDKDKEWYEIEFDLGSLDLDLPATLLSSASQGRVRERVSRELIFVQFV